MEPFKDSATPRTVMALSILISTGAHSSTMAFVLHRTRIGIGLMKKFGLDYQGAVNFILASSFIYQ
jgi:hypothetical protein